MIGLQETASFRNILNSLTIDGKKVRELVRYTPFANDCSSIMFPFLVIEAKSSASSDDFQKIEKQTALPIMACLKLQQDLCAKVKRTEDGSEPLNTRRQERESEASSVALDADPFLWFFAYRGDFWHVYGCYVTMDEMPGYVSPCFISVCLIYDSGVIHMTLAVFVETSWIITHLYLDHTLISRMGVVNERC